METKLNKFDIGNKNEYDYNKQLTNFNIHVFIMGGGTQHLELLKAKTLNDV